VDADPFAEAPAKEEALAEVDHHWELVMGN